MLEEKKPFKTSLEDLGEFALIEHNPHKLDSANELPSWIRS